MKAEFGQASTLQLFDATGVLLRSWPMGPLSGAADIDMGMLSPGMYLFRWVRPAGEGTRKVVVMKQ